ncbi:hypothetical protein H5410_040224 [Solanum commersonii]|uniref:Amidohydrolase 3 domain-containing protein n=1 Tax=Solanum commersonii TaxID=4109 RepID=A0A9J5XRV5_SOLCO|nr:hypothetical protein H5410_040224 [Solanum commersonii]
MLNWRSSSFLSEVADLLVTNGTIYTSDEALPFADSMAIRNGRILRVGNYSSIKELARTWTKELNLDGKIVVPGFIDSHLHFIPGGLEVCISPTFSYLYFLSSLIIFLGPGQMKKKLSNWKKEYLSSVGRVVLINTILDSLSIYRVFVSYPCHGRGKD